MSLSTDVLPSPVTMEPPSHSPPAPAAAFASPRTPQNTPPNSANRRIVRPLLKQQRKNTLHSQTGQSGNASYGPETKRATVSSPRYPDETLAESDRTANFGMTASTVHNDDDAPSTAPAPVNRGDGNRSAAPLSSDLAGSTSIDNKSLSGGAAATETRGHDAAESFGHPDVPDTTPAHNNNTSNGHSTDRKSSNSTNESNSNNSNETRDEAHSELSSIPIVHCPPIRASAPSGSFTLRAVQPHIKRIHASRPGPLILPRADTPMSLASYPSNLSSSPQANSSASSSFAGISSGSKPGNATAEAAPAGPKLSSPSPALLTARQLSGVGGGVSSVVSTGLSGRPAPPLLRTSLSTHTLQDDVSPSSASSYANRTPFSGPAGVSPRLRVGPTPPHLPSSAGSVASTMGTPLSSNRSSARPSFLRMAIPAPSVSPTETGQLTDTQPPLNEYAHGATPPCGMTPLQRNNSSSYGGGNSSVGSGVGGGVMRAVNGRVLASPHGARRPELSARRTTFDRTASTMSFHEGPSAPSSSSTLRRAQAGDSDSRLNASAATMEGGMKENSVGSGRSTQAAVGGAGASTTAGHGEPTLTKEMRSFVLGQYRTLQREVLTLPTAAERPAAQPQTDVHAADFVHVKRSTCPRHSKAAKRAEQKRSEEERLRALQQQHHDMEIIKNGGREQIGHNMKSSTMLAGSLSKLRSRHKSSTVASSMERTRNSLDRTISAAFESEGSPFGPPEEVTETALYGESPFSSLSPERKLTQQPSEAETVKKEGEGGNFGAGAGTQEGEEEGVKEAWHTSKSFLQSRTTGAANVPFNGQDRRGGRTMNKNGMKGEAIVVAVMPDSDDDDEDGSGSSSDGRTPWRTHLTRTKGSSAASGVPGTPASMAANGPAKRAGEQLPQAQQQQKQHGTALGSSSSLLSHARSTKHHSGVMSGRNTSNHNNNDGDSSSSSSDDDACFSFNKLRSQRLRSSTLSLSTSQPLDQKNLSATQPLPASARSPDRVHHRPGKMLSPSKESSSDASGKEEDEDDNEEGDENTCCFCCPCKKPENFFVLCRAGSQSGSFVNSAAATGVTSGNGDVLAATTEPERVRESSPTLPEREQKNKKNAAVPTTSGETAAPAAGQTPPSRKADSKNASDSRVLFEDLEDVNDDDEPLLSMQSFRRTSIQRVR